MLGDLLVMRRRMREVLLRPPMSTVVPVAVDCLTVVTAIIAVATRE